MENNWNTIHFLISGGAVVGFFIFNLISLLIGFYLGKQVQKEKQIFPEKEKREKEPEPFVENVIEDDPWNIAQLPDDRDKGKIKIVGGL